MSSESDTIVIKAPAGTKARWVCQAGGMKLSDWVVQQVDRPANETTPAPCPKCRSVVLVADAQCGLVA